MALAWKKNQTRENMPTSTLLTSPHAPNKRRRIGGTKRFKKGGEKVFEHISTEEYHDHERIVPQNRQQLVN